MIQTFATLTKDIEDAITKVLTTDTSWIKNSQMVHERYMSRDTGKEQHYLTTASDALTYLALRTPSTYAQSYSSLLSVQEVLPSFAPKTVLDIGSGPGVGIWASKQLWPSIVSGTAIDVNNHLLYWGEKIAKEVTSLPEITWKQKDITHGVRETDTFYDLVVISSVLNELTELQKEKVLEQAYEQCKGVLVITEPGTDFGNTIIQTVAKKYSAVTTLIAPFVGNSFVQSSDYWLHFTQRFIRPEFLRRIRQYMRDSYLMASDWESAKYCYVAMSKMPFDTIVWGRCIGPVEKEKGFVMVPILTKEKIEKIKVMKRHKSQYTFARDLKWGEVILKRENIIFEQ